ncbi:MAG TPA: VOC family protein [Anaerolineales bacterium]|nr:VOC family protein [Anaerolineales bacterium]
MKPAWNHVLIELHVPDFEKVKEYYGRLGFEVVRETKPQDKEGYLVLNMEDNILCFWAGNEQVYEQSYFKRFSKNTKRGYGVEIVIMVGDLEALYNRVQDSVNVVAKLAMRPWGLKDFRIEDPFGYYIRITSIHNIFDDPDAQAGK